MQRLSTFILAAVLVSTTGVGCNSGQALEQANLTPEALGRSSFVPISLVSQVKSGDKDTELPVYLVLANDAYVIPVALRQSFRDIEPGTILNCPPVLYQSWQKPGDILKAPLAAMTTGQYQDGSERLSYRYQNLAADAEYIGFNGRLCYAQVMHELRQPVILERGPDIQSTRLTGR